MKFSGYIEVVWDVSFSVHPNVDSLMYLNGRLHATDRALTSWSARKISNVKQQILLASETIRQLHIAQYSRALSAQEAWLRNTLKVTVVGLASLERAIARQQSRTTMLAEGDTNTSFFHRHTNYPRRKKHLFRLARDGSEVT